MATESRGKGAKGAKVAKGSNGAKGAGHQAVSGRGATGRRQAGRSNRGPGAVSTDWLTSLVKALLTVNDADAALLDAWGLTTPPPTIPETSTLSITDTGTPLPPRHDRRARVALPVDAEPSTAAEEIT